MMKTAILMAGAAVLSLTATGAVAQVNNFNTTVNSPRGGNNPVTRYTVTASGNKATQELNDAQQNSWKITGFVPADCVFYAGNGNGTGNGSTQTLDLGEIGIEGQSNLGADTVFDLQSPIDVTIGTGTAGCNTANSITISKSTLGLTNEDAGAYDPAQFQANIPYSVKATFNTETIDNLDLSDSQDSNTETLGAWRSAFNMAIRINKPSKGLVAGTYSDVVTVRFDTDI